MKLHIGVDSETGLAQSAAVTAAKVHDKHPLPDLLHGEEQRVHGGCAYASQGRLIQAKAPGAMDRTNKTVRPGRPHTPKPSSIVVQIDDLLSCDAQALVAEHLAGIHGNTPAGQVDALEVESLRRPDVTLWTAWMRRSLWVWRTQGTGFEVRRNQVDEDAKRLPEQRRRAGRA